MHVLFFMKRELITTKGKMLHDFSFNLIDIKY